MFLKATSQLILAALLLAIPINAQSVPAATASREIPVFAAGAGFSSYDVDWGHGRMNGGTLWADWYPSRVPVILRGLAIEAEARDISLGHSSTQPSNFRQDTAGGGLIYSWRHYGNFHPYAKILEEFGSIDFQVGVPGYTHDTRSVTAPGIGLEYRIYRRVWVRADYEYQYWPNLFGKNKMLDPQGFTLGAIYEFRHSRRPQ